MKKLTYILLTLLLAASLPISAAAAETVESQIRELPTVEEFKAMDSEDQLAAYNEIQAAYDAYAELSEEEKGEIEGAEERFEELFTHINSLVMPIDQTEPAGAAEPKQSGKLSFNGYAWALVAALGVFIAVLGRKRK